jgi:hypothetical protein
MTPRKLPRKKRLTRSNVPEPDLAEPADAELDVPTWGAEGGAGEHAGGPTSRDVEDGTNATEPGGDRDHPPGGKPRP